MTVSKEMMRAINRARCQIDPDSALESRGVTVLTNVRREKDPKFQRIKACIQAILEATPDVVDMDRLVEGARTNPGLYRLWRLAHGVENDTNYDVAVTPPDMSA